MRRCGRGCPACPRRPGRGQAKQMPVSRPGWLRAGRENSCLFPGWLGRAGKTDPCFPGGCGQAGKTDPFFPGGCGRAGKQIPGRAGGGAGADPPLASGPAARRRIAGGPGFKLLELESASRVPYLRNTPRPPLASGPAARRRIAGAIGWSQGRTEQIREAFGEASASRSSGSPARSAGARGGSPSITRRGISTPPAATWETGIQLLPVSVSFHGPVGDLDPPPLRRARGAKIGCKFSIASRVRILSWSCGGS